MAEGRRTEITNNQGNPDAQEADQSLAAAKSAKASKANKVHKARKSDKVLKPDPAPQLVNLLEGFSPEEIASLARVKQDIERGRYTDITDEHRKLLFVKWLVDHDKLGS
jgi:hypothetical protein